MAVFCKRSSIATEPVRQLHQSWNKAFNEIPEDAYIFHACHSQGAIHTRNALISYPENLRKRILVVAIAPAAYIYKSTCANVVHYRTENPYRDLVTRVDRNGSIRERDTIRELKSHPDAPWHDHSFASPTYREALRTHISRYKKIGNEI